jgi:hypothetical protein
MFIEIDEELIDRIIKQRLEEDWIHANKEVMILESEDRRGELKPYQREDLEMYRRLIPAMRIMAAWHFTKHEQEEIFGVQDDDDVIE